MKKYNHPIDDLFRETLQDHRMVPSNAAKKAFLQDVMRDEKPGNSGKKGLILLAILGAIVGTGFFIWALYSKTTSSNPDRKPVLAAQHSNAENLKTVNTIKPGTDHNASLSSKTTAITEPENKGQLTHQHANDKSPRKVSASIPETPIFSAQMVNAENHPSSAVIATIPVFQENSGSVSTTESDAQAEVYSHVAAMAQTVDPVYLIVPDSSQDSIVKKTDSAKLLSSGTNEKPGSSPANNRKWNLSLGIYYTPEWMFNTLEDTKFVNNFGVEGTFRFDRFSIRTGAGLSLGKGTNEIVVEYNDFLGAYNKLDSMDFTWNDPAHQYVPTMYVSKQDVWDSLMKLDYARVVKRYTYLQVPMILGYDFWQTERISIGVRMGPVLSVLLATKQLSGEYDPGTKRIVSINDIAPEQVSLNWQVMAGMNAAFRLNKTVSFEIEPCARYYFNSVYEKPADNSKPWSVGVRAAFVIKL